MNPEVFYLHIKGEQRGPYTVPQIDHLLNSGLIESSTLFWREGLEQWQPVTDLVAVRKPVRRWMMPAFAIGFFLFLLLLGRLFWPIIRVGWQEANQREYTEQAVYWRSRDLVRHRAVPPGDVVEFAPFSSARAVLQPPDRAVSVLGGTLIDAHGNSRRTAWNLVLVYERRLKEWSLVSLHEMSVAP